MPLLLTTHKSGKVVLGAGINFYALETQGALVNSQGAVQKPPDAAYTLMPTAHLLLNAPDATESGAPTAQLMTLTNNSLVIALDSGEVWHVDLARPERPVTYAEKDESYQILKSGAQDGDRNPLPWGVVAEGTVSCRYLDNLSGDLVLQQCRVLGPSEMESFYR